MNKKNATKKISENNQIPLLVRSGQWQVVERTEEHIAAVRLKNIQDDQIDEQKKLIAQLMEKVCSQDKQMTEQKECIRSQDAKIKSQDIRINLQDEQIKEMHERICSQNEQIQDQNKLITELQEKWESQEERLILINQSKETDQAFLSKMAVLMADTCNVNKESFVFGSKIKRKEISAIYTQDTLQNVPSDAWDVSAGKDRSVMAWTCKDTDSDTHTLYLAGDGDIYANPDSSYLFSKYEGLTKADFTHLKTDMVTNMKDMFCGCSQLQALDVSKWNVSNVTDMHWMFYNCSQLETLDVSKWNVSNVTDMHWMFYNCSQLETLDVSKWNVSNVTNMRGMFCNCSQLQALDVSKWDVSNVKNMHCMFYNCSQLQVLDVSKWNVSNVTDMGGMFEDCSQLQTLDVSNWNVSNVTDMHCMFSSCSAVNSMKEGELSSWKLHPSVDLEDFCRGTKFEKMPTALFKNRGRSVWESLKSSLK